MKYQPRSNVLENSVWNEMLILNNDPDSANFAFNEMANRIQVRGALPWERPKDKKFWRDADTAQLKAHIDVRYVPFYWETVFSSTSVNFFVICNCIS